MWPRRRVNTSSSPARSRNFPAPAEVSLLDEVKLRCPTNDSSIPLVFLGALLCIVAQQTARDAPSGFTTPMLAATPGSQSVSNGIAEPAGDIFAQDQAVFETIHDASTGLGPLFNGTLSIVLAITCYTMSAPAMESSRPARRIPPTSCVPCHCGVFERNPRYMHDLASLTLEDAIARHRGEARRRIAQVQGADSDAAAASNCFLNSL